MGGQSPFEGRQRRFESDLQRMLPQVPEGFCYGFARCAPIVACQCPRAGDEEIRPGQGFGTGVFIKRVGVLIGSFRIGEVQGRWAVGMPNNATTSRCRNLDVSDASSNAYFVSRKIASMINRQ